MKTSKKIVFLDRDGTINVDLGYVTAPHRLLLIPEAANAIAELRANNFEVVIVTNQSAIARAIATEQNVIDTNNTLLSMLTKENSAATISQVLFAPDHPDKASDRRKPGIGMLRDLTPGLKDFDLASSWMVGDKLSDIEFGLNAGLLASHCILVLTGGGKEELSKLSNKEVVVAESLAEAAKIIAKN